jgi:hypothetical protein
MTIFEYHSTPESIEVFPIRMASDQHAVFFFVTVPRVCQAIGQFSIIGKQDQPLTFSIQSPHREECARDRDEITYRAT